MKSVVMSHIQKFIYILHVRKGKQKNQDPVQKSRIRETLNLSTDADRGTDTIFFFFLFGGGGGPRKKNWQGGSKHFFSYFFSFGGQFSFYWRGSKKYFFGEVHFFFLHL